jgi:outer membrane protein assembly factor BamA
VQGQRYRIEAAPSFGSINFTSLLADYRRYFMPAPFYTIATRVMHYGRYGSGSDDTRLFPLFIGYPNLVRGYDVNTFDGRDCPPTLTNSCPAVDRLMGTRFLVTNVELRFPLLRPFGLAQRMYGPVPVEVALFADAGVAWTGSIPVNRTPAGLFVTSVTPHPFSWDDAVSSAGVALRANLFGYAVAEFSFSRPFQRPGRGWIFQFNLAPGF